MNRSTLELVALAFTATVCLVLLLVTVGITVAGVIPPNDALAGRYLDAVIAASATMLGALLGLLAGRRHTPDR